MAETKNIYTDFLLGKYNFWSYYFPKEHNRYVHHMCLNVFIINTGSTIQGDHILAFWKTQKSGSIPNESTWNTQHSVSRDMHTLF